ncbi:hypothetical protein [Micromonospora fluostatini]
MDERPHDGPLPGAYPVPGGSLPLVDGDRVPWRPGPGRRPLPWRRYVYGGVIALVVLLLVLLGIVG